MGRVKVEQEFPADDQPGASAEASALVADNSTMTIYGQTMGEIMDLKDSVINRKHEETVVLQAQVDELTGKIAAKDAKITELVEYSKQKNMDLGVARMALQQAKASTIPQRLERLAGGGIRLAVSLDIDESAPLLSWADSAGEDPAEYISRQIKDALVAVTSS
jgi:hypothetical protein